MELYKQGLSDRQIGKLQGVTGNAIHLWRKNHGLKANWAVKKAESKMGLYKQGLYDTQIAERLGVTRAAVYAWRRDRGLPSNREAIRPGSCPMEDALTPDQCQVMRRFLGDLVRVADMRPGKIPDVMAFMSEWRRTTNADRH